MMNVVYIHTHDSGRYLSPYGYALRMPNLMALAQRSTLFRQAYCAAPTCSPSRVGLLSGMAPHSSRMLGLAHRGFGMEDYSKHLAAYLRGNGFTTALAGIQHEAADVRSLGYDIVLGDPAQTAPSDAYVKDLHFARAAEAYIRQANPDRPFFLSYGLQATHRVYPDHRGEVNPDYVIPPFPIADNAENRADMAGYIRSAQDADACVGVVLDALSQSGQADNTLILFSTDHGIAMPFMKCSLYDTGIGVALMMHYPGNPSCGRATDALVSQLDVFPTLCALLKLPPPDWLQGVSLLPVLNDPGAQVREALFAEVTYHAAYEPMRCIRTQRYKLIRFYDDHLSPVPANIDASPAKNTLLKNGWLSLPREREMLFDLSIDPAERHSLIGNPLHKEIYEELNARLFRWMRDTRDPLLEHPFRVPAPGGRINKRESLEPTDHNFEEWSS